MKKKFKLLFLIAVFLLFIAGCSDISISSQPTNNDQQSEKDWHIGVPAVYKGYYGKQSKAEGKSIDPLTFQKNKVSFDDNTIKNVKYQQLSEDSYIIKGIDQNNSNYFVKLKFKNADGKWRLGVLDGKKVNHKKYDDVKKNSKNPTWYQEYSKDKFDKLTKGSSDETTSDVDTDTETIESSDSSNSSNLSISDLQGRVFTSSKYQTEFLSFMADPDSYGLPPTFSLYNVRMSGAPYPVSYIQNPKFDFKGDEVTISGDPSNISFSFYGEENSTVTLKKISSNQLQDTKTKVVYTEYNGSQNQLVDDVNSKLGYPVSAEQMMESNENDDSDDE